MELFRTGCVLCRAGSAPLCSGCARQLPVPPNGRVRGIGPLPALFAYEGMGATVVQALKFRDGRRLVGPLADGLCGLVPPGPVHLVTWVPTSAARRRRRGFDQAELLAQALGRRLDVPCRPLLRRVPGPSQTGRSRAQRSGNVRFVPARRLPPPCRAVVVDDVCTTGATIRSAAHTLATAGWHSLDFAVVARTP